MFITWVCRNCGDQLARVAAREEDPRLAALTVFEDEDIIEYDYAGNMSIRILCEDCLEALQLGEETEIEYLRGPEYH